MENMWEVPAMLLAFILTVLGAAIALVVVVIFLAVIVVFAMGLWGLWKTRKKQ
jgi:hypothetical protein